MSIGTPEIPRIAIIGGGLSGLAAAHRCTELAARSGKAFQITVFESLDRLGGAVATLSENGYLIERGADSFLTSKPAAVHLCERLGLADQLIPTDAQHRQALVLHRGRPQPVPDGFNLMQPSAFWPMLKTPLLTPRGKLRLLREWWIAPQTGATDESLESFVTRRLGRQAFERLVQPLVSGIYTADPAKLSLAATLPRFLEMEKNHGGLIRAAVRTARDAREARQAAADKTASGARYGLFAGLKGGMEQLLTALRHRIANQVEVHLRSPVEQLTVGANGWTITARAGELSERFDAVIVALPAYLAAQLLGFANAELAGLLKRIPYASSAVVANGYKFSQIAHPLRAFGLVVPTIERRKILAVSFASRKFPGRAPDGSVLLRTFVGGALHGELLDCDDAGLRSLVARELTDILGVQGAHEVSIVSRYPRAMPQYHVGHLELVEQIELQTERLPHLKLTGSAYRGVGMPDVIADAERAADQILQTFMAHPPSAP